MFPYSPPRFCKPLEGHFLLLNHINNSHATFLLDFNRNVSGLCFIVLTFCIRKLIFFPEAQKEIGIEPKISSD
jgi:hypothetical protein